MNYDYLDENEQRRLLRAHVQAHEADHFNATMNIIKAKAAKDPEGVKTYTAIAERAESDAAAMRKQLAKMPKPAKPDESE